MQASKKEFIFRQVWHVFQDSYKIQFHELFQTISSYVP